jgi:hypothetical protein
MEQKTRKIAGRQTTENLWLPDDLTTGGGVFIELAPCRR